jgi:hypothetical protein
VARLDRPLCPGYVWIFEPDGAATYEQHGM